MQPRRGKAGRIVRAADVPNLECPVAINAVQDIQLITQNAILQTLAIDRDILGWWAVPRAGLFSLERAIEIGNTVATQMVLPGISVSIDATSIPDNSRYGGSQRRKQQSFSIAIDHWLQDDIDLTNQSVNLALMQNPGLELPTQFENFTEVLDLIMDTLGDMGELNQVRPPIVQQRGWVGSSYVMARAQMRCVGAVYGEMAGVV